MNFFLRISQNWLHPKGFTLIETLVAVLGISLSLGALMLVTSRSVIAAREAEQRIGAELLAVESLEIAQQLIYSNIVGGSFIDPFGNIKSCGSGCTINYSLIGTGSSLSPCNDAAACGLVRDNSATSGLPVDFGSVGASTPFRRLLYTKPSPGSQGVLLRAVVWYSPVGALVPKSVVITRELHPWYTEQDPDPDAEA